MSPKEAGIEAKITVWKSAKDAFSYAREFAECP
jgi:hypothetical protein